MKKLIALLFVLMTVMSLMIPVFASAEETAPTKTMWVNCANGKKLNVRSEASTSGKLLYRLDCGIRVTVKENVPAAKGWVYVTAQGHRDGGFVMSKFLVEGKPGKYEITERDDNFRTVQPYTVTALALNDRTNNSVGLRTAPNKTAKMVRRLSAGDRLEVIAVGKVWSKVFDPLTGKTGYMANDYMAR